MRILERRRLRLVVLMTLAVATLENSAQAQVFRPAVTSLTGTYSMPYYPYCKYSLAPGQTPPRVEVNRGGLAMDDGTFLAGPAIAMWASWYSEPLPDNPANCPPPPAPAQERMIAATSMYFSNPNNPTMVHPTGESYPRGAGYFSFLGILWSEGFYIPFGTGLVSYYGHQFQFEIPLADGPTDCLGTWSEWAAEEWSACSGGTQRRTETRAFTIARPPSAGGRACPATPQSRKQTRPCEDAVCSADACLVSPARRPLIAMPPPDGCSVPDTFQYKHQIYPSPLRKLAAPFSFMFEQACFDHDQAYTSFATPADFYSRRLAADNKFLRDMSDTCALIGPVASGICQLVATAYYTAVRARGEENFVAAQKEVGTCPNCGSTADEQAYLVAPPPMAADGPAQVLRREFRRPGHALLQAFGRTPLATRAVRRPSTGQLYISSAPMTVDDGVQLSGIQLYESGQFALAAYDVTVPSGVSSIDFAMSVLTPSDGDALSISFDGVEVWSSPLARFTKNVAYAVQIPATNLPPSGRLQFTLLGAGARNAVLLLGDLSDVVFGFGEPQAPANVVAQVAGSSVALQWQAAVPRATHYLVEASLTNRGAAIARLNVGSGTAMAVSAPPGRYWVRVIGVNEAGEGEPSQEVEVVVRPAGIEPPVLTVPSIFGTTVGLSWSGPVAARYSLVVRLAPSGPVILSLPVGTHTTFSATGVTPGRYYVSVVAQVGTNTVESNQVTALVSAP